MSTPDTAGAKVSVYASIREAIREFIRDEQLRPGDRLPPERQLASQLGVSRTSLRQALTALKVEGLIDVRHGHGMRLVRAIDDVVPPIDAGVLEGASGLATTGEVRNALEALAARLAAERRDSGDMEAMVAGIREMDAEVRRGEAGLSGDRSFHTAVMRAARNDVLAGLLGSMADQTARIAEGSLTRPGQPERSLAAHRLIFEAITARDAEEARRLMDEHLEITGEISRLGNGLRLQGGVHDRVLDDVVVRDELRREAAGVEDAGPVLAGGALDAGR